MVAPTVDTLFTRNHVFVRLNMFFKKCERGFFGTIDTRPSEGAWRVWRSSANSISVSAATPFAIDDDEAELFRFRSLIARASLFETDPVWQKRIS